MKHLIRPEGPGSARADDAGCVEGGEPKKGLAEEKGGQGAGKEKKGAKRGLREESWRGRRNGTYLGASAGASRALPG